MSNRRRQARTAPKHARARHGIHAESSANQGDHRPRVGVWIATGAVVAAIAGPVGFASAATPGPSADGITGAMYGDSVTTQLANDGLGTNWAFAYRAPTAISASRGQAQIQHLAAGSAAAAWLPSVTARDTTEQVSYVLSSPTSSASGLYLAAENRKQSDGRSYRAKLTFAPSGEPRLSISRVDARGGETTLGYTAPNWPPAAAGQTLDVEIVAVGVNPTVVSARAWPDGSSVPAYELTEKDSSSAQITGAGGVGLWVYRGSACKISDIDVTSLQARQVGAAGDPTSLTTPSASPTPKLSPSTKASASPTPKPSSSTTATASATPKPSSATPSRSTSSPKPTPSAPAPSPTRNTTSAGQPGANNTGVPAGAKLTVVNGPLHITKPGVYSNLDVHGFVYVEAPNVTLQDSIIRGGTPNTSIGLVNDYSPSATNFVLRDSELVPSVRSVYIDGIQGSNYTALRINIHGTVDGAKIFGDNSTIESSWIHGLQYFSSDPHQGGAPTHNDDVQVLGGHNLLITKNTLDGGNNSAVQVTQTTESVKNLSITGNWVGGGACTINLQDAPLTSMSGITVNSNIFSHTSTYNCPIIAYAGVTFTHTGDTWVGGAGAIQVITR